MAMLIRMNSREREFAERNHHLIEQFICAKGLDGSYYHVLVMGYLMGVQDYLRDPALMAKVSFKAVAWRRMLFALRDERRAQSRKQARETSLEIMSTTESDCSVAESMGGDCGIEMVELLDDLKTRLDQRGMDIIRLKIIGYSDADIAQVLETTVVQVRALIRGMRATLMAACCN